MPKETIDIGEAINRILDNGKLIFVPKDKELIEVVRCKDCVYYKEWNSEMQCWARPMLFAREPHDYCSMGEKK